MKNIEDFLLYLEKLDVKLWVEGDRLRYSAPKGTMKSELLDQMREQKTELIQAVMQKGKNNDIIQPAPRNAYLPLSLTQERMWFLSQIDPDNPAYNIPGALHISGVIDASILEKCFDEIIRRHEVLRTTFAMKDEISPIQIIEQPFHTSLPVKDIKIQSENMRNEEIKKHMIEVFQQPFDLTTLPLIRFNLLRLAKNEHILLLVMHHIITDGWSTGIFIREMIACYEAFSKETHVPMPELPIQYADFAVWQRTQLKNESLEKQLRYWKKQLAESSPILQLPSDRSRSVEPTFKGAAVYFRIDSDLTEKLHLLSRKSKATLFMTLLASFSVLLYRYSGQDDISVGTPIANRNRREIEPLIGFFINTLVLRTDLSGNPSFSTLLERVRRVSLDAYDNQDVPFEKLVETLQPKRSLNRSPMFQVMFILQNAYIKKMGMTDLVLDFLDPEIVATQLDLVLEATEEAFGLKIKMEYSTDLFDESTILRMAEHWQVLLEGIAANPDCSISKLPLITMPERLQLLTEFNDTAVDYPHDKTISSLFEEQAKKTPDISAVIFEGIHLTYRQLNEQSNQVAHFLKGTYSIRPDDRIGVLMNRSEWLVIGLLGIMKAGGAYVPIDPTYPAERIQYMLTDSGCKVLLTTPHLLDTLPDLEDRFQIVNIKEIRHSETGNPVPDICSRNLAYVIYTSGSTGQPKGVMIEHRSIVNTLCWRAGFYDFGDKDCVLQIPSYSFDSSVEDIFTPLISGAGLVMMHKDKRQDIKYLEEVIKKHWVTHFLITPAFYKILLIETNATLDHLRFVTVAGERIDEDLVSLHFEKFEHVRLYNEYGPTENSVCATIYEFDQAKPCVLIGKPIDNNRVYILDPNMQICPVGVFGEICISGAGLAQGYLNREQLTSEKFVENPFSPKERMYRTGDVGRWLSNGNIDFSGRNDDQVKIRGYRIELGEIENVLTGHPAVQQAVIIAREDSPGGNMQLIAYVVPDTSRTDSALPVSSVDEDNSSDSFSIDELRSFLKDKLPDYMVPSAFIMLVKMPLTSNGKVDRQALPVPDQISSEAAYVKPRNEIEQIIAAVWKEVLNIEKVGIHDNFFDIGGHSLLIIRVQNRLRMSFDKDIQVVTLFRYPTIEALAQYLSQKNDEEDGVEQIIDRVEKRKNAMKRRGQSRRIRRR